MDKKEAKQKADLIRKQIKSDYGPGWYRLSDTQKSAVYCREVLFLILGQVGEKYAPAKELARAVMNDLQG